MQRKSNSDKTICQMPLVIFKTQKNKNGEIIKHLDLDKFKVEQCQINTQHNHKHCIFYHTIKDSRRMNSKYQYNSDLCEFQETPNCKKGEACLESHNRVERLYHIDKYKTKFCTQYPKNIFNCEYGEYCSFAHSVKDIKTRLINLMKKDKEFYMFYFKTEWCPQNKNHNKAQCEYAHNWQDFRRKPDLYAYDGL